MRWKEGNSDKIRSLPSDVTSRRVVAAISTFVWHLHTGWKLPFTTTSNCSPTFGGVYLFKSLKRTLSLSSFKYCWTMLAPELVTAFSFGIFPFLQKLHHLDVIPWAYCPRDVRPSWWNSWCPTPYAGAIAINSIMAWSFPSSSSVASFERLLSTSSLTACTTLLSSHPSGNDRLISGNDKASEICSRLYGRYGKYTGKDCKSKLQLVLVLSILRCCFWRKI